MPSVGKPAGITPGSARNCTNFPRIVARLVNIRPLVIFNVRAAFFEFVIDSA